MVVDKYYQPGYHVVTWGKHTRDTIYKDMESALKAYDNACKRGIASKVILLHRPNYTGHREGVDIMNDFLFFSNDDHLDRINCPKSSYRNVAEQGKKRK